VQAAFLVVVGICGLAALCAPTSYWVLATLLSSFTFQGLTTVGVLPSLGTVLPIAVAWGTLLVALLRSQGVASRARPYLRWLVLLFVVALVSAAFNHVELLRPFFSIGLLGVPYALLIAVLVDPPTRRERALLLKVMMGLIALQVPIALWQFATHGGGDPVQGTFVSRGGGAHTLGAVSLIGAVWLLAGRVTLRRIVLSASLVVLPFIADAKQILFALPIAVLMTAPQGLRAGYVFRVGLAAGLLAILLFVLPVGKVALGYVHHDASQNKDPKAQVAEWLWRDVRSDPVSLTFGKGPAETVSLAAYYTTPGFLSATSPFHALGLAPAELAIEANYLSFPTVNTQERSSFESPVSSALGVFGDLGLTGLLTYGGLLVTLLLALSRVRSREGVAAMTAVALFAVLGLIYGWWEAPGLPAIVGAFAALALTGSVTRGTSRRSRSV
jgi:hypothetical protein